MNHPDDSSPTWVRHTPPRLAILSRRHLFTNGDVFFNLFQMLFSLKFDMYNMHIHEQVTTLTAMVGSCLRRYALGIFSFMQFSHA